MLSEDENDIALFEAHAHPTFKQTHRRTNTLHNLARPQYLLQEHVYC